MGLFAALLVLKTKTAFLQGGKFVGYTDVAGAVEV